jgi:hypothetical protein
MTIPTARICSQCQRPHNIERLTKVGERYICPSCLMTENTQPRRRAETVKTKRQTTFKFVCSCCTKKISDGLEQQVFEDEQIYILCPRCYSLRRNIITSIRRINEYGKDM